MNEYADRLAPNDKAFKESERMRDFGELPDPGDYHGIVHRFDFFEARKTGRLYLKTEVKLITTEVEGWQVEMIHDLEDPDRYDFLKTHLHRLGIDTDEFQLSRIEELVRSALDVPVEINIYDFDRKDGTTGRGGRVNKVLGPPMRQQSDVPADTAGMKGNGAPAGKDASIPFRCRPLPEFGAERRTWPPRFARTRDAQAGW